MPNCSVIILAAGQGTRMKSSKAKVLHEIAGTPMLAHVLEQTAALSTASITIVLAPGMDDVQQLALAAYPGCQFATQEKQLGTGHAVKCAMPTLPKTCDDVLVVYGDTPLIKTETLQALLDQKTAQQATIALAGIYLDDPTGYGRLIFTYPASGENNNYPPASGGAGGEAVSMASPLNPPAGGGKYSALVEQIVECKDASAEQKHIRWGWGGIMAFSADFLSAAIEKMQPSKVTGEYYLTELLQISTKEKRTNIMSPMPVSEAMGVNDKAQLAAAEAVMQERLRYKALQSGVTMLAPETVFLRADTTFGRNVLIHPHVVFGSKVSVADNVEIKPYSHIEGATIGENSIIGPYARLRPGSELAADVRIGNFVEIKKSTIAKGAKINHLSYVGDSEIGSDVNIGAGTITCNYDGKLKYKTTIKAGAFIGSNTALVAPITIGKGALIGAGSVITQDVPDNSLALGRARQVVKEDKKPS